jgi:microcystin-dependent protein
VPSGAILAFDLDICPSGWEPFDPLDGRVVVGAGSGSKLTPRRRGDPGGAEEITLEPKHLPQHTHAVYPHAGAVSPNSGTPGASGPSKDPNPGSNVQPSQSGPGPGSSAPLGIMPPFYTLLYCKKK